MLYDCLQQRFSEDLDIRVTLSEELERGPAPRRIEAFRAVSAAFASHVHRALPFLETTRMGRFRKRDGRFESDILPLPRSAAAPRGDGRAEAGPGAGAGAAPLQEREGLGGADVPLIGAFEIAMGKWQALARWLAGRRYTGAVCVRHPLDLAAMSAAPGFERDAVRGVRLRLAAERRGPGVTQALRELQARNGERTTRTTCVAWGSCRSGGSVWSHSTWPPVRRRVARMALNLDLGPVRDRREVEQMARAPRGRGGQSLSR